jgi:hypothetical protein
MFVRKVIEWRLLNNRRCWLRYQNLVLCQLCTIYNLSNNNSHLAFLYALKSQHTIDITP